MIVNNECSFMKLQSDFKSVENWSLCVANYDCYHPISEPPYRDDVLRNNIALGQSNGYWRLDIVESLGIHFIKEKTAALCKTIFDFYSGGGA